MPTSACRLGIVSRLLGFGWIVVLRAQVPELSSPGGDGAARASDRLSAGVAAEVSPT